MPRATRALLQLLVEPLFYHYVSGNILNANEVMLSMSRSLTFHASIKDSRTIGGWCFAQARRSAVGKLNIFALYLLVNSLSLSQAVLTSAQ